MMSYNPNTQQFIKEEFIKESSTIDAQCVYYSGRVPSGDNPPLPVYNMPLSRVIESITDSICFSGRVEIDALTFRMVEQEKLIKKLEDKIDDLVRQVEKLSDKEILI